MAIGTDSLVSDDFTRSDNGSTLGSGYTASSSDASALTFGIVSNHAQLTSGDGSAFRFALVDPALLGNENYTVKTSVKESGGGSPIGIFLRTSVIGGNLSGYFCYKWGSGAVIARVDNGVATDLDDYNYIGAWDGSTGEHFIQADIETVSGNVVITLSRATTEGGTYTQVATATDSSGSKIATKGSAGIGIRTSYNGSNLKTWDFLRVIGTAAGSPSPTITDVDTDEAITAAQANVAFTVTNAGATQDASTLTLTQGSVSKACSIDSWSATSIQADTPFDFTAPTTSLKYGAATARLTVGAASGDLAITITAPSGKKYVDLASINTTSAYRFTTSADIAIGDQIEISDVQGGTVSDISLNTDGSYDVASAVTRFTFRVWSAADKTWDATAYEYPGAGLDTTPDAFSFADQSNVSLSTVITSAPITVAGINSAAAISVTGGTYSVNGGGYTSGAGTVNNGDTVTARHTSSATNSAATNTAVTIGGVSDTFTSTTLPVGGVPVSAGGRYRRRRGHIR